MAEEKIAGENEEQGHDHLHQCLADQEAEQRVGIETRGYKAVVRTHSTVAVGVGDKYNQREAQLADDVGGGDTTAFHILRQRASAPGRG